MAEQAPESAALREALEQSLDALRRQTTRLQVLNELSHAFSEATTDYPRLLDTVAQRAATLIGDSCNVRLISDDGARLELTAVSHPDPAYAAMSEAMLRAHPQPVMAGFSGVVIGRAEPTLVAVSSPAEIVATVPPPWRAFFTRFPLHSMAGAPLRSQGRVFGLLMLGRHEPGRSFTPDDLTLLQDLADRAALAITNARLIEAMRREREAVERAVVERTQELEDFVFAASHDLQEPLRKITTFGDFLAGAAGDGLSPQGGDYLRRMQSAAHRMRAMMDALLTFSRVLARPKPVEPVDLAAVVSSLLLSPELGVRERGAVVTVGALPTIDADPQQMRLLLFHLLDNALKFAPEAQAPEVTVTASAPGGPCFELCVRDRGIGFDERYLDRIFRPFQQLQREARFVGAGIGLTLCKKIAERHGGTLTATSAPGEGATFIVRLPWTR